MANSEGFSRRAETILLTVILLGIVVLSALQIVLRNVFSYALFWADDLVRMAVLWLAMIGGMAASREGRHIAMGIVPRYCPKTWHKPAAILSMSFAAVVTAGLAWHSYRFVADSYRFGDTVLDDWPAWAFQAVMPVGFAVMSIRFALQTVAILRGRK
jgi:TRAP-type C4-dicarboxylate transport system permease small subunit